MKTKINFGLTLFSPCVCLGGTPYLKSFAIAMRIKKINFPLVTFQIETFATAKKSHMFKMFKFSF